MTLAQRWLLTPFYLLHLMADDILLLNMVSVVINLIFLLIDLCDMSSMVVKPVCKLLLQLIDTLPLGQLRISIRCKTQSSSILISIGIPVSDSCPSHCLSILD